MKLKRKEKLNLQLFSESGAEAENSQSGENISVDAGQV